jgi:hypothetical protein
VNSAEEKVNGGNKETVTERANENGHGNGNAGTKNGAPQFDWIKQRSECSLPKVFAILRSQIEQDVNERNSLRPKTAPYEFSVSDDINEITVRLQADQLQKSVAFTLADHAIVVRGDQGNRMFEVTLAFDDGGNCRLHVDGQDRDFWQVRRMALEDLMFRGL